MLKFALALVALLLVAAPAVAETLTDAQVVQLSRAGLSADAIVAKIRVSPTRFDISTEAMVALKRDGVPDAVIAAMVASAADGGARGWAEGQGAFADPAAPHAPGVYLLQPGPSPRMQRLDPTLADDTRTTSIFGWFFSYGVVPLKVTTILNGPSARFRADTPRPTFYFYFNQPGSGLYRNGIGTMRLDGSAPSPSEFALIRFQVVVGVRQALTQEIGGLGNPRRGDAARSQVAFNATEIAPGLFEVTPDADLPPGEYAFAVTPATDGDDGAETRYFDFSTVGE